MIKVGDFVKGISNKYNITNTNMTKGVVTAVLGDNRIAVKVLEHASGKTGKYDVTADCFEVIGHVKEFNREEVLELLRNGCKKALLDYDLSDADLSDADLSDADLSDANLSDADLSDANLRRADLSGADLRRANLRRANLSGADLRRANLSDADLSDADLSDADLSDADLSDADLRRANLRRANLSDADLSDANLSDANLRRADLSGADLRRANLSDADLSGADLSGADLRRANLRRANLDFSCYPLWCGGLRVKTDKRLACQLAYHLCSMQCEDEEYIKMRNSILDFANQFHRVNECGRLEPVEVKE